MYSSSKYKGHVDKDYLFIGQINYFQRVQECKNCIPLKGQGAGEWEDVTELKLYQIARNLYALLLIIELFQTIQTFI